MKQFGLGKKKAQDEESTRSSLFGRSKDKSRDSQMSNPYANLPTQADAYNQAKARAGVPGYVQPGPSPAPPSAQQGGYGGMNGGYPDEKKSNPYGDDKKSGGYGSLGNDPPRNGGGYGADRYGAQSGYGGDRYGSGAGGPQAETGGSKHRPGGYGGLGRTTSHNTNATDDNRDALFGGAKDRVAKQSEQQMGYGQPPPYEEGQEAGYGGSSEPRYEAYGNRQLTAEEEEDEDVQGTKQQIRFIKQEDVSSTRNAVSTGTLLSSKVHRPPLAGLANGSSISYALQHRQKKRKSHHPNIEFTKLILLQWHEHISPNRSTRRADTQHGEEFRPYSEPQPRRRS